MLCEEEMKPKKNIEPTIVYKEIHGQLVPVKVYPTLPSNDSFDNVSLSNYVTENKHTSNDYTVSIETIESIELEFKTRLN